MNSTRYRISSRSEPSQLNCTPRITWPMMRAVRSLLCFGTWVIRYTTIQTVPGDTLNRRCSAAEGAQAKEGKSMSDGSNVQELNRQLAAKINAEARANPQSPYANKFIGIANGKVVVVAENLDEMSRRLRQMEPDPSKCFGVEASRDYSEVIEILGAI